MTDREAERAESRVRLSAVVLTKNEATEIVDCLASLRFCDDVLVVDSGSSDATRELARAAGARVVEHEFVTFAESRNFGLDQALGEWVLSVDADERIPDALRDEIVRVVNAPGGMRGFRVRLEDCFCGQWLRHGESARVRPVRLARRDAGRWTRRVHEYWDVAGAVGELSSPIHHFSHRSVGDFVTRLNSYSTLDAAEHFTNGVRVPAWHLLAYPIGKFGQNYIVRRGVLDGAMGLGFAMLMSFYSFLVRMKLMLLWRNAREQ